MKHMKQYVLALMLSFFSFAVFAATTDATAEVTKAGQAWQQAIASRNAETIATLYSPHAFLYATFDNMIDDHAALLEYFKKITMNENLQVTFDKQHVRVYGNVGINSGLYTFSYKQDGKEVRVPARYTFVYLHEGNKWLIIDHHSSVLPKPPAANNSI